MSTTSNLLPTTPSSSAIDAANEALASIKLSPEHTNGDTSTSHPKRHATHTRNDSSDSTRSRSPSTVQQQLQRRPSSPAVPTSPQLNGKRTSISSLAGVGVTPNSSSSSSEVAVLRAELERMRAEKDTLDEHYRSLLEKVTAMRTTLGNKLKQDAEELDRREQVIQTLSAESEDLTNTITTLNAELVASNDEAERLSTELETLRNRTLEDSAYESSLRERDVAELERVRIDKDEWERAAQEERVKSEELRVTVEKLKRQLEIENEERAAQVKEVIREKKTSANLQSVLEDFQAGKDREIRQAVGELESQLRNATNLLAEFKHRAYMAEEKLASSSTNAEHTATLEKEVKEKTLLIGKLRHEAVILNEHLTEALRRLRKSSSESSVDRRLVTNVLIQFITAPRGDTKKFQMLSLLAGVLGWDDNEREKAGLQRVGAAAGLTGSAAVGASASVSGASTPPIPGRRISSQSRISDAGKLDEPSESFSKMWVEFLLKESSTSNSAQGPSGSGSGSGSTPTSAAASTTSNTLSPPMSPATSVYSLGGPITPISERRPSFQLYGQPQSGPRSLRATSSPLQHGPAGHMHGYLHGYGQGGGVTPQTLSAASSVVSAASSVIGDDDEPDRA